MSLNPPVGFQHIIPCLHYEDPRAAIEVLCGAFGFTLNFVKEDKEGRVHHAELGLHGETLMLAGAEEAAGLSTPERLGGFHAHVAVYVTDLDAHYAAACRAGVEILEQPTVQPWGDRRYVARDPQGYRWSFQQPLAAPEDE